MDGALGISDIETFIRNLIPETGFNFKNYFDESKSFDERYQNDETFYQAKIYARLDNGFEKYSAIIAPDKIKEFQEQIDTVNNKIKDFIATYAEDETKVPSYEKRTFLCFRRVPDNFGIQCFIQERNKSKEDDEYYSADDRHYTPSASAGDYSPSCPWNAPGMSISDFI